MKGSLGIIAVHSTSSAVQYYAGEVEYSAYSNLDPLVAASCLKYVRLAHPRLENKNTLCIKGNPRLMQTHCANFGEPSVVQVVHQQEQSN